MLYLLHGTDTHKARAKLHGMLAALAKKRPDAEVFKITSENWSEAQFDELLIAQGLFDQKYIVVLDNLFEKKDVKEYILERLVETKEAEHVFLMLEGKVDAPSLKKIEKVSAKSQVFEKAENKKEFSNIFSITDYLIQKNKKGLWISYIDLLGKGIPAEEIHGVLFWAAKNMLLVTKTGDMKDSGLSPFVFKNASRGAENYTKENLLAMSSELVDMTYKVRSGLGELPIMLEKWILRL